MISYKKDLAAYQRKANQTKGKAARDDTERYFETLRRTLELADGLDVIIDRHMADRSGKYIVFCSGAQHHMHEMMDMAYERFRLVEEWEGSRILITAYLIKENSINAKILHTCCE